MKLRELRGAIRKSTGNISMRVLMAGTEIIVRPQKTALLEDLGNAFEDGVETGISFDLESGFIDLTGEVQPYRGPISVQFNELPQILNADDDLLV